MVHSRFGMLTRTVLLSLVLVAAPLSSVAMGQAGGTGGGTTTTARDDDDGFDWGWLGLLGLLGLAGLRRRDDDHVRRTV